MGTTDNDLVKRTNKSDLFALCGLLVELQYHFIYCHAGNCIDT